jgi:hypothetical protein
VTSGAPILINRAAPIDSGVIARWSLAR